MTLDEIDLELRRIAELICNDDVTKAAYRLGMLCPGVATQYPTLGNRLLVVLDDLAGAGRLTGRGSPGSVAGDPDARLIRPAACQIGILRGQLAGGPVEVLAVTTYA